MLCHAKAGGARALVPQLYSALEAGRSRDSSLPLLLPLPSHLLLPLPLLCCSLLISASFFPGLLRVARGAGVDLDLRHYCRADWSYHAKGLWLWPPPAAHDGKAAAQRDGGAAAAGAPPDGGLEEGRAGGPVLSAVGSTNFGQRSVARDTELTAFVVATDASARRQMGAELDSLLRHTRRARGGTEAPPSLLVRALARLVRSYC